MAFNNEAWNLEEERPFVLQVDANLEKLEGFDELDPLKRSFLQRYAKMRVRDRQDMLDAISSDSQPRGMIRTGHFVQMRELRKVLVEVGMEEFVNRIDGAVINLDPPQSSK